MKLYATSFFVALLFYLLCDVDVQQVKWAVRFRNFSAYSSFPDTVVDVDYKIFQAGMEHRLTTSINITRNVISKRLEIKINRCNFESFACEYFQTWKFDKNLQALIYMKNQMWSPFTRNIQPKIEIPLTKKGVYRVANGTFDVDAIMKFYPGAIKYYFKITANLYDDKNRLSLGIFFEVMFFEYVERNHKKGKSN